MPYSTGCKTPLSNFEAGQNYKDVLDPAIMVRPAYSTLVLLLCALVKAFFARDETFCAGQLPRGG